MGKRVMILPAQLIEFSKKIVVLEVILDEEKEIFQERVFPAYLFSKIKGKKFGDTYLLKMTSEPRKCIFEIIDDPDSEVWQRVREKSKRELNDAVTNFSSLFKKIKDS
jgi:hypothetical protein